ncbi:hypothetical protein KP509_34G050200 [Ceratopteris richardii]|uniref:Uncharacterized protein n=1 Tax=Ceratopteris richardii TaxID=49495 RepID=A0A8T2QKB3_CERRI|nr:hypothetical protein KP509_34G050200 [Ceratopteris richardii]
MATRAASEEEVLLGLYHSAAHSAQKEAWEAERKSLEQVKIEQENELRGLRKDAYQVASMYAMFQSVIFSAVSQSTHLNCQLSWCPASLCAAVYIAALLAIADKLKGAEDLRQEIDETNLFISAVNERLDLVYTLGAQLDLDIQYPRRQLCGSSTAIGLRFLLRPHSLFSVFFLTSFSVLVGLFSSHVLCEHCSPCW